MLAKYIKFHGQRQSTLSLTVIAIARVSEVACVPVPIRQYEKGQVTLMDEIYHVIGEDILRLGNRIFYNGLSAYLNLVPEGDIIFIILNRK